MTRRLATLALLSLTLVAALLATGCGGDDDGGANAPSKGQATSSEARIRATVVTWYGAVARGDGATACALMTPAGKRRDLADQPSMTLETDGSTTRPPTTCKQLIASAGDELRQRGIAPEVDAAAVRGVRVLGDQATANTTFASRNQSVVLRREDGRWLIDGTPS